MSSTEDKALVFVYGTLKTGEPNHFFIKDPNNGNAKLLGRYRTVDKWPVVISSIYNIPFLLYDKGKGHNVIGEVYEVDMKMLKMLDDFENHPDYYERMEEQVEIIDEQQSQTIKAWMYFLREFKASLLELPFIEDYASEGSHGLPYVSRYNSIRKYGKPYIFYVRD